MKSTIIRFSFLFFLADIGVDIDTVSGHPISFFISFYITSNRLTFLKKSKTEIGFLICMDPTHGLAQPCVSVELGSLEAANASPPADLGTDETTN